MSEPDTYWPTVIAAWLDAHERAEVTTNSVAGALAVPLGTLGPKDFAYIYRCIRAGGWRRGRSGKWIQTT